MEHGLPFPFNSDDQLLELLLSPLSKYIKNTTRATAVNIKGGIVEFLTKRPGFNSLIYKSLNI